MNESEEEERERLEFEEFKRKKRGSGQAPSSTNPLGAGRPTESWRRFQQFLEWEKLQAEGLTAGRISEIFDGFRGHAARRGEGDSKGESQRYMGRIVKYIFPQANKKMIESVDKATEPIEKAAAYTLPYVVPYLAGGAGVAIMFGLWYGAEMIPIVVKVTAKEKEEMISTKGTRILNIEETDDGKFKVIYKFLPQFLHTIKDFFQWSWTVLARFLESEHDIVYTDFINPTSPTAPKTAINFLSVIFKELSRRTKE